MLPIKAPRLLMNNKGNLEESEQQVNPADYQLISLTAFYMSMKLYGNRLFPLVELVKLGRGQFTVDDVANMELKLVNQVFDWPSAGCCRSGRGDILNSRNPRQHGAAHTQPGKSRKGNTD